MERRFFQDDLPVKTNKSTTVRHTFTSEAQMPDDLTVQEICSSSSVKTAIVHLATGVIYNTLDSFSSVLSPILTL